MADRELKKRPAIKQHRDLLVDPRYKNRTGEVGKKVRLSILAEQDFNQELKEFLEYEYRYQQQDQEDT